MELEFNLSTDQEFIELIKLLKVLRLAESGGQAKGFVEDGLVKLNNQPEWRKRAKLRKGDMVEFDGNLIKIL